MYKILIERSIKRRLMHLSYQDFHIDFMSVKS